ncbi:putative HTH-type transcriptional repressor ExuR [compost metagenome]
MGLTGLQAFKDMGIRIPQDISVVSFDDHDSFKLHTPTITVIEQPIKEIAVKSIQLLMSQMTDMEVYKVEKSLKKGKLIIRESV